MPTPKVSTPSFRTFDFFDKAVDGVKDTSLIGAFVSVASVAVMAALFVSELWAYLHVDAVTHMRVNAHHELRETRVHLHLTFLRLPCDALTLEVENVRGGRGLGSVTDHAVEIREPNSGELRLARGLLRADADGASKEACTLQGDLTIARVGGVLHIKVPNSDKAGAATLDHYIHDLTFGEPLSEFKHPLRGMSVDAPPGTARVAYTLKVVPTAVTTRAGRTTRSFQYSARSEYETKEALAANREARRYPGVHFAYDFTPVMVHREEDAEGFLNFLTSTCAIVGGVFTMSGLLVGLIHGVRRTAKRD